MTPGVALLVTAALIAWLLVRDARQRPHLSPSVWLVMVWTVLIASRSPSSWLFGTDLGYDLPGSREAGHPLDAFVYTALIAIGLSVLIRRSVAWDQVFAQNWWLGALYVFWLTTVLWSDYPVVTAKRLVKDFGNVVMILILLTEQYRSSAVRAALVRSAYVCVPLSLLVIRYYPAIGRTYVGYHGDVAMYVGVASHKNSLGVLAFVAVFVLAWDALSRVRVERRSVMSVLVSAHAFVLAGACYLVRIADSATSLLCVIVGVAILALLAIPVMRESRWLLESTTAGCLFMVWMILPVFDAGTSLLRALGRDPTLTSRVGIWDIALRFAANPLVGAGYNTFWTGERVVELQAAVGGGIIQAHNGYLDVYLNGGLVGLGVLALVLTSGYRRLKAQVSEGGLDARFRLTILMLALLHNLSEASFSILSLLWFVTLVAVVEYDAPHGAGVAHRRDVTPRDHALLPLGARFL
jgi:O-antigen ligase